MPVLEKRTSPLKIRQHFLSPLPILTQDGGAQLADKSTFTLPVPPVSTFQPCSATRIVQGRGGWCWVRAEGTRRWVMRSSSSHCSNAPWVPLQQWPLPKGEHHPQPALGCRYVFATASSHGDDFGQHAFHPWLLLNSQLSESTYSLSISSDLIIILFISVYAASKIRWW